MNTDLYFTNSASISTPSNSVGTVDIEDIVRQAAMHAASSGFIHVQNPMQITAAFNAADDLSLQRIQSQINRVSSANKNYWVT